MPSPARFIALAFLLLLPAAIWMLAGGRGARPARTLAAPLDTSFPLELEHAGPTLTLAAVPERVLPANAAMVDIVAALVPRERVVALPEQALAYSGLRDTSSFDAWRELPELARFSAEGVLGFEPDLVLTHTWSDASTIRALRQLGVAVLVLPVPETFADLCVHARIVGAALGEPARAAALVVELERRRAALLQTTSGREQLRALSYTNFSTGGFAAGAGTTADLLIELAGMHNAGDGLVGHARVDHETLIRIDPDLFLVGSDAEDDARSATGAHLASDPLLASLRAVRAGRIVVLPARLHTTTSHYLLDAAERLARDVDRLLAAPAGDAQR